MSQNKVHSNSDANISVPFKWEKQPGVSKLIINSKDQTFLHKNQNLPLPPCYSDQRASSRKEKSQIRAAVSSYCSVNAPLRSCSKRRFGKQASFDRDPFLVAFKECTKPKFTPAEDRMQSGVGLMVIKKSWFRLCCKKSCGVRDDALVKNQVLATYE